MGPGEKKGWVGDVGAVEGSKTGRDKSIVCNHCQPVKLTGENIAGDHTFKISVFSTPFSFAISFGSLNLGAPTFSASCPPVPDAPCLSCTFLQSLVPPGARPCQDTKKMFLSCLAEDGEMPPWGLHWGVSYYAFYWCVFNFSSNTWETADRNEWSEQLRPLWHSVLAGGVLYMVVDKGFCVFSVTFFNLGPFLCLLV